MNQRSFAHWTDRETRAALALLQAAVERRFDPPSRRWATALLLWDQLAGSPPMLLPERHVYLLRWAGPLPTPILVRSEPGQYRLVAAEIGHPLTADQMSADLARADQHAPTQKERPTSTAAWRRLSVAIDAITDDLTCAGASTTYPAVKVREALHSHATSRLQHDDLDDQMDSVLSVLGKAHRIEREALKRSVAELLEGGPRAVFDGNRQVGLHRTASSAIEHRLALVDLAIEHGTQPELAWRRITMIQLSWHPTPAEE
jgi:hypothetical protein